MEQNYEASASGYLSDSFEGISRKFTDIEVMPTPGHNLVARAKRYGRWWVLKGLKPEVAPIGKRTDRHVHHSKNRLRAGDTFRCSLIVEGEPLYIDDLRQEGHPPVVYVCGKKSGVRFDYPLK